MSLKIIVTVISIHLQWEFGWLFWKVIESPPCSTRSTSSRQWLRSSLLHPKVRPPQYTPLVRRRAPERRLRSRGREPTVLFVDCQFWKKWKTFGFLNLGFLVKHMAVDACPHLHPRPPWMADIWTATAFRPRWFILVLSLLSLPLSVVSGKPNQTKPYIVTYFC